MAGIPGWALALGALNEAPKVAGNWVNLFKNVQDLRGDSNANDALKQLEQFKTSDEVAGYQPDGYLDPATRLKINELRRSRTDELLKREASPIQSEASRISRIAAVDPTVGSPEGLRDFAERPEFWTGGTDTGAIPGAKKSGPTSAGNPYVSQAVQQFAGDAANKLNAFRATGGDRMAVAQVATNKDLAAGLDNAAQSAERFNKMDRTAAEDVAKNRLNQFIAEYPLQPTVDSWNGLVAGIRNIPGVDPAVVTSTLKDMADRNNAPVGRLAQFVKNGPNSTRSEVATNMFGEPIANTKTVSSNNPSDRELGLVGGGDGDTGTVDVSWVGPDGTAQAATIPRSELPGLKSSLQAQGVKKLSTVDGKKPSRTETLIAEPKGKKSWRDSRPVGSAAPVASSGGFTYKNGKLVPN